MAVVLCFFVFVSLFVYFVVVFCRCWGQFGGKGNIVFLLLLLLGFLFVCLKKKYLVCYCRSNLSDGEFPFVIVLILSDAGCLHGLALDIVKENM